MLRSKARLAVRPKRSVRSSSRPKALITRMPTALSSASSDTSPTRCCTSMRIGLERRL